MICALDSPKYKIRYLKENRVQFTKVYWKRALDWKMICALDSPKYKIRYLEENWVQLTKVYSKRALDY